MSRILTFPRGSAARLSDHFSALEFDCRCGHCPETLIDESLIVKLEEIRALACAPVRILSGYRCADRQAKLREEGLPTAAGPSTHEFGRAADIMIRGFTGLQLESLARRAGFRSVGVAEVWVHVDTRDDCDRHWVY